MKLPIQRCMVEQGIVSSTREAAMLIMSGRVYVNGQSAKAGQPVKGDESILVKGLNDRYVSKGGYKLERALEAFGITVAGRVAIDAGASTGGFTDCLLRHGASRVYAVDTGFGQLMGSLRQDERVVNLERVNIGDEQLLLLSPRPTLGTVDLSYLSLRKAVPQFAAILHEEGELVCLVKPLFETQDNAARRSGGIEDGELAPLLHTLAADLGALPYCRVLDACASPVTGNKGTREFFFHIRLGESGLADGLDEAILRSVEQAIALPAYEKQG